ncbi:MAG: carbohydrate binding domain-containing protein [Gammaproteobacteria bacterium]
MFKRSLSSMTIGITACLMSITTLLIAAEHSYMDDNDYTPLAADPTGSPNFHDDLWPRLILAETKSMAGDLEKYSKYNIIATQAALMPLVAELQTKHPEIRYFRMFTPREVQEYESGLYCTQSKGIPFSETGPATEGCAVYAGHWLYSGGTTLTNTIDASTDEVEVSHPNIFQVGQYAAIYDAPAASFENAEHVKIIAINGATLTIQRGYQSTSASHPTGSIIAQHVLGQGGNNPLNWSYNLSTACPKDSNGNTVSTVMADFLRDNLDKDRFGETRDVQVSGVLFDVDFFFELNQKMSDVNNDLIIDHGITPEGFNMWGVGMDDFYTLVRNNVYPLPVIAGTKNSRGFGSLSGAQIEGWVGGFGLVPDYRELDSMFAKYIFSLAQYKDGPLHTHVLNKQSTKLYPKHIDLPDNKSFRLGFGLALMGDGYYGQENDEFYPDPWYDEYSVDITAGSATYGSAISSVSGNENSVINHLGWLGKPKGDFKRLYDNAAFSVSNSLIANGDFENGTTDWKGLGGIAVNQDSTVAQEGSSSLHANGIYSSQLSAVLVRGPAISLVKDRQYTLAFASKASSFREVTVKISSPGGAVNHRVLTGPEWTRRLVTFTANYTGDHVLSFLLGRESTDTWFDAIYLFEGNANIFRRDFDHGIALVNATPSDRTINLGAPYQRILGTQDTVNDGSEIQSITIPAFDGIVLVNKPGYDYGGNGYIQPGEECGEPVIYPETDLSLLLWKDCTTGQWNMHASGGGSDGVTYHGRIDAASEFYNLGSFQLESTDKLLLDNNNQTLKFTLRAWKNGQDGVDFAIPSSADACLKLNRAQIKVGIDRLSVPVPFNLRTLGDC